MSPTWVPVFFSVLLYMYIPLMSHQCDLYIEYRRNNLNLLNRRASVNLFGHNKPHCELTRGICMYIKLRSRAPYLGTSPRTRGGHKGCGRGARYGVMAVQPRRNPSPGYCIQPPCPRAPPVILPVAPSSTTKRHLGCIRLIGKIQPLPESPAV